MIRWASILFVSALAAAPLPSPLSPADALKAFEVAPGLRVELVAAEPIGRLAVRHRLRFQGTSLRRREPWLPDRT